MNEIMEKDADILTQESRSELEKIAEDITHMSGSLAKLACSIGERFVRAKAICPKGEWESWCRNKTGYSQRSVDMYMNIYREYGAAQVTIAGDLLEIPEINGMGVTKLDILTGIPADERAEFVKENGITSDTTTAKLKELIKEYKAEAESARNTAESCRNALLEKEERMARAESEAEKFRRRAEELEEQIRAAEINAEQAEISEMEKMRREAEEEIRRETQEEIEKLREKAQKEAEKAQRLREEVEEQKKRADAERNTALDAKEAFKRADKARQKLKEKIEELKSKQQKPDDRLMRMNVQFERAQQELDTLMELLEDCADIEGIDKYRNAVFKVIKEKIELAEGGYTNV